ncbi:LOW QUALITY PROTEIN: E3 ubiquitin/ISG15 ligase TRIM25-like [Anomaloglossus baeobatrachus]|uniref:LOW QUALITY PROTEIN: E3 ubiquitin/ISG15 ligase TRIM25-like n=1 Tax=Anomaloglossus baeobatrachus TaxID=238106 RepID=UPI003F5058F2
MASAGLRKELECSICLNLYTDPVILRCGHNFCRDCIDQVLNMQDESGVYSCPECREEFQERPTLKRNITLCNIVEDFLSTQPHQEITGICCTYCVHDSVPAVRSCLHCEASLCDNHLRVHSKGPEHVLTDPSTSLENRICSVHKKILEYYCTEDAACICASCCLIGEHRGHKVEMLGEASEKRKTKLRNFLQTLTTKREKTDEKIWRLEENWRKGKEKMTEEKKKVIALFIDIRRRVDNVEKKVVNEISRRQEQVSLSLSDVIQKLEIKKDEMSRKMRHIEELCNMSDPLTVLQDPDSGDLCDPEDGGDEDTGGQDGGDEDTGGHDGGDEDTGGHDRGDEDTGGHDGGDEDTGGHDRGDEDTGGHDGGDEDTGGHDGGDEDTGGHDGGDEDTGGHDGGDEDTGGHDGGDEDTGGHDGGDEDTGGHDGGDEDTGGHDGGDRGAELISHIPHTLSDIIRDINVTFSVQDPADILLDIDTAANNILISDDLKTMSRILINQNRPKTANRFQEDQVLSCRRFSSGRHYWDVEIRGSALWKVGMCYPSIDRSGRQSYIGNNNKSWCLCGGRQVYNNQCSGIHDNKVIPLPLQICSDRVRIYVDYEAGQLSFYELSDPIRHLHTFTAAFSEPLHAALYVHKGCIKLSDGAADMRPHHEKLRGCPLLLT